MNSITRIILRGLLSGEIKAEPEVFEYLREVSERQFHRHSRILRFVRPAAAGVAAVRPVPPDEPPPGRSKPSPNNPRNEPRFSGSAEDRKDWPTFASVSCGRWVPVTVSLLVGCLVLGVANVQASVPAPADAQMSSVLTGLGAAAPIAAASFHDVVPMTLGVTGLAADFPRILMWASGGLLGCILVRAGWRWFCRNKLFVMRPYELALQNLEATQYRAEHGRESDPRHVVLDILKDFFEAQFRVHTRETGSEALENSLARNGVSLTAQQRLLLQEVLDPPAKTATTTSPQSLDLCEKAARFIWSTAGVRPAKLLRNQTMG